VTFARDAIPLLKHNADTTFHHLHATAEEVHCDGGGQEKERQIEIPGLIEMRSLADG
jgi:hypothetical protein